MVSPRIQQDLSIKEFPQKWELFKMSIGMQADSELTGEDMRYQENYIFESDSTFSKTRIQDSTETIVRGTYSIKNQNDEQLILLTFYEENSLIGNCSTEPVEYLNLHLDTQTLFSNWWACDGPGLYYKQVSLE
ncbi:hypothetical protein SAMN04488553_1219 [Gramella sp. MAR_2010_147]|nr:hypothetical protein SAMN04488553_1219 [Gramella sp. MAR_2010_147]